MVMMFYIVDYLSAMPALEGMPGGSSAKMTLEFGVWVIAVFALIFLMYTNSFLMRRRKKEFGLYNILGMEKKNLSALYIRETLIVFAMSVSIGLIGGIALSKMAELGLVRMLGGDISYEYKISGSCILTTLEIFGAIFLLLFIKGILSLWRLNAISLLKSENSGEKPPKANYLLGIGGIILLGAAYYIAVSIKSPLLALGWFFIAVIMVILATYMIFISGSVMLCRLLQKNKKYYYNKKHFISVSSMAYRMKRNGAGLASICILSTMVLVIMLGAGSLYFGAEDSLRTGYPSDIEIMFEFVPDENGERYSRDKENAIISEINKMISERNVKPQNARLYTLSSVTCMLSDGKLTANPKLVNAANAATAKNVCNVYIMSLDEYNRCMNKNETLEDDEIFMYFIRRSYDYPTVTTSGEKVFKVKGKLTDMIKVGYASTNLMPSAFIVINHPEDIYQEINSEFSDRKFICAPETRYEFDTNLKAEDEIALADDLKDLIGRINVEREDFFYSVSCREKERGDFYGTYGGLFYLGIILSVVFLTATVLIIYYKQITEGYEDESRFTIMQKIGMTKTDIKKSINSQMLTVFLLPLLTAVLHVCFAFPLVQKLLALFNLTNIPLMITVLVLSGVAFGSFYAVIYKITSNAYFKIVCGKNE